MHDAADAGPTTAGGEGDTVAAVDVVADTLATLTIAGTACLFAIGAVPAPPVVQSVVGLLGLLVVPGYAFTTAAFPARTVRSSRPVSADASAGDPSAGAIGWATDGSARLGGFERVALSVGLSVALAPVYGIFASEIGTGAGLDAVSSAAVLFAVVAALSLVGLVRRLGASPERRHALPLRRAVGQFGAAIGPGAADPILNLALVGGILVASVGFGAALVAPQDGTSYTDVALLTEGNESQTDLKQIDGRRLVSHDYPTEFERGESAPVYLSIENREGRAEGYSVVVELQRLADDGTVVESTTLDRFERRVPAGETALVEHSLAPTMLGDELRVAYLVYRQTPPEPPTVDSAYRSVSLSVNVTASGGGESAAAELPAGATEAPA